MSEQRVVTVTLAQYLPTSTAVTLGIDSANLVPGAQVDVPYDAVRRMWIAGLLADPSLEVLLGLVRSVPVEPKTFTGPNAPDVPAGTPYVWFQTGTGASGTGTTIWIEDGL